MAYSTSFPPVLAVQPMAFGSGSTQGSTIGSSAIGGRLWFMCSTHLQTDVATANFITNGGDLGMKPHDVIMHVSLSSGVSFHRVFSTGISSTGGVHASAGLTISSAS
jgi:hypothetical protein